MRDAAIAGRHGEDDSPRGSQLDAQYKSVFVGKHHAIHEFTSNYPRWGLNPSTNADIKYNMPVTIQWLFATGRDHPLWTVTFDLSQAPAGAVDADTRAPYRDWPRVSCGNGRYCPEDSVTREQMAAFIIRSLEGERPASYCGAGSPFSIDCKLEV